MIDLVEMRNKYNHLLSAYLAEAEEMFGPKTEYIFDRINYYNGSPMVIESERLLMEEFQHGFEVKLNSHALHDLKDGIFQLSHEVVHLLCPILQEDGNEANKLEEGMAVYFSKIITQRDTDDLAYVLAAIHKHPNYREAYELYLQLIEIDPDAVKKIRAIEPVVAQITPEHFGQARVNVDIALIDTLLSKF